MNTFSTVLVGVCLCGVGVVNAILAYLAVHRWIETNAPKAAPTAPAVVTAVLTFVAFVGVAFLVIRLEHRWRPDPLNPPTGLRSADNR